MSLLSATRVVRGDEVLEGTSGPEYPGRLSLRCVNKDRFSVTEVGSFFYKGLRKNKSSIPVFLKS